MAELTPEQREVGRKLVDIFLPSMTKAADALYPHREGTARFAHYTSADAALNIIRTKRLWMRNATCMVDYSEMGYGYDILLKLFTHDNRRADLISALDACIAGAAKEAIALFDNHWPNIRRGTYVASLSQHCGGKEDIYGRLSMWRAFGAATGTRVAMIVNIPHFSGASLALQVIFSPVSYAGQTEIGQELDTVIQNVRDNAEFLRTCDPLIVRGTLFAMLLSSVVCVKHEAFSEELEWRAIYASIWGDNKAQVPIQRTRQTIQGVPQHVYELPLDGSVSSAIDSLDFAKIFDRLIVGPTQYPVSVADVFAEVLTEAGVKDAGSKIQISGIPIRT